MPHTAERRRHPRRPCRLPVRGLDGAARTTDVSEGGARVQRLDDRPLVIGDRLDLELSLPDGPLRATAEVVGLDGAGPTRTGAVRFAALAPDNVRRLRALTQTRAAARAALRPGARPLARIALIRRPLA